MTALSRPVVTMLATTLDTPTGSITSDITRLRESLTVALQRCLDEPAVGWERLVEVATDAGDWNEWRVASLLAAAEPAEDPEPEVTREALAELAGELIERGGVFDGPWEGGARQAAVESERWQDGRRRREFVFAIERAMECVSAGDADGLRSAAHRCTELDVTGLHPQLPAALRTYADELASSGRAGDDCRVALRSALAGSPFAAFLHD